MREVSDINQRELEFPLSENPDLSRREFGIIARRAQSAADEDQKRECI